MPGEFFTVHQAHVRIEPGASLRSSLEMSVRRSRVVVAAEHADGGEQPHQPDDAIGISAAATARSELVMCPAHVIGQAQRDRSVQRLCLPLPVMMSTPLGRVVLPHDYLRNATRRRAYLVSVQRCPA